MIDVHCHLLPGIDDGARDLDVSLALARQAVADGVTHAILTPHIHLGRWDNSKSTIRQAVSAFRRELSLHGICLSVGYAAEVRIDAELLHLIPKNEIPFLGVWEQKSVLLLEMPHSHISTGTDKIIAWLLKHNVIPMIAHPERNKDVMRKVEKLYPLIDLGCLFQVTAGSVFGQFGELAQERARELLQMGVVTVLASDAHHIHRRPVNLREGRDAAAQVIGPEKADALVYDNPLKMVGSQFMVPSSSSVKSLA